MPAVNPTQPVTNPQFPPPMELGPGPADPTISSAPATYTGTGYGTQPSGRVGTINPYPPSPGT